FRSPKPGGVGRKTTSPWVLGSPRLTLQFLRPCPAKPKRNYSNDSKRTVNQPPPNWYAAKRAERKGIRNYQSAGNHPKGEKPYIADRIAKRADEGERNREMSEGQPVGAVEEEGMIVGHGMKRILDFGQPYGANGCRCSVSCRC